MTVAQPGDVAHVRRVTLNLIRHAAVCPEETREVIDRLASRDWDFGALTQVEADHLYGVIDGQLADRAKDEFEADTRSIIDHRGCDAECKLCGQMHIRFEFLLRNGAGGRDVWTGSTCIVTYGLAVDGETTAEEALKRLNAAINAAKRIAERDDWRAEHPNHEADMEAVRRIAKIAGQYLPYDLWNLLKPAFRQRARKIASLAKASVKYYNANGFLTDTRTRQLYLPGDALNAIEGLLNEWDQAVGVRDARRAVWRTLLDEYGGRFDEYGLSTVKSLLSNAVDPRGLGSYQRGVLSRVLSTTELSTLGIR